LLLWGKQKPVAQKISVYYVGKAQNKSTSIEIKNWSYCGVKQRNYCKFICYFSESEKYKNTSRLFTC
jgi:hypothetical protein